jgi:hypothetical protein
MTLARNHEWFTEVWRRLAAVVGKRVHDRAGGPRVHIVLDDTSFEEAGKTVWRMFAPEVQRAFERRHG